MQSQQLLPLEVVALTSAGVQQLGPLDEAQVARPGPQCVRLPEAEPGVEVVRLQALLAVDCVVAAGTMRATHPDLSKQTNTGVSERFVCFFF